jgi:hypothetical protein
VLSKQKRLRHGLTLENRQGNQAMLLQGLMQQQTLLTTCKQIEAYYLLADDAFELGILGEASL